jgi:hypothetical protein
MLTYDRPHQIEKLLTETSWNQFGTSRGDATNLPVPLANPSTIFSALNTSDWYLPRFPLCR